MHPPNEIIGLCLYSSKLFRIIRLHVCELLARINGLVVRFGEFPSCTNIISLIGFRRFSLDLVIVLVLLFLR